MTAERLRIDTRLQWVPSTEDEVTLVRFIQHDANRNVRTIQQQIKYMLMEYLREVKPEWKPTTRPAKAARRRIEGAVNNG